MLVVVIVEKSACKGPGLVLCRKKLPGISLKLRSHCSRSFSLRILWCLLSSCYLARLRQLNGGCAPSDRRSRTRHPAARHSKLFLQLLTASTRPVLLFFYWPTSPLLPLGLSHTMCTSCPCMRHGLHCNSAASSGPRR